jgi:glycosyltransferase involved in cell wall biosynthesis
MRIILATPIYPPEIGGPATYAKELSRRLAKAEHITIVAFGTEAEAVEGVKIVMVRKDQSLLSRLVEYFFVLLREARVADTIYVQNAVASGLPAVLVGMLLRKPVVLKFVGDEAWERASQKGKTQKNLEAFLAAPEGGFSISVFLSIQKFVLNHVSAVVPPSEFLGNILNAHYGVPASKITVNYNAFEGTVATEDTVARKPHQILSVSRLVTWKRVDGIINALKILKHNFPDVTLVVAGEGPEEAKLKKLAQELGVEASVTFLGRVLRADTDRLEKESGVMVLNSTYEGLPHIALESFATHTPLVATDIPGTREAVIHERSGLLVPQGDDATLAVAIGRIFNEPELREKVVSGATELLREKFSWDQHIQNLLAVFSSLKEN